MSAGYLRRCAEIEQEFMQTNQSYDPIYIKYCKENPGDKNDFKASTSKSQKNSKKLSLQNTSDPQEFIRVESKSSYLVFTGRGQRRKKDEKMYKFIIKNSSIPNAGEGVFTEDTISANTLFGPYPGVKYTTEQYEEKQIEGLQDNGYTFEIPSQSGDERDKRVIVMPDSYDVREGKNWVVKINHNTILSRNNMKPVFDYGRKDVYYQTTKEIKKDEELFVDYGEQYNNQLIMKMVTQDVSQREACERFLEKRSTNYGV